jgi:hypothetical protein
VREIIEYRFRVPSAAVFTLYSYSKALEYRFRVPTAGSLRTGGTARPKKDIVVNVVVPATPTPCLVARNFAKIFNVSRHIESLEACMKH